MTPTGRIVLLGATGYTGQLTAEALVGQGQQPILVARDPRKLAGLTDRLGDLETAQADVQRPESLAEILREGDVLISTVGPFQRLGGPVVQAAIDAGVTYVDSSGEPPFVRRVFEHYGPRAEAAGTALIPAFGYDYVPGNLAGALALEQAGPEATRVDVGYFLTGGGGSPNLMSRGTAASLVGVLLEPGYAWRSGIETEAPGRRTRRFRTPDGSKSGLSIGSSEHFALPRSYPALREVNTYLGWFGPFAPIVSLAAGPTQWFARSRLLQEALRKLSSRLAGRTTLGPESTTLERSETFAIGEAYDAHGRLLTRVNLRGPNGYPLTGGLLAWAAGRAATTGVAGTGALGPVEAFGLDDLREGAELVGLNTVD